MGFRPQRILKVSLWLQAGSLLVLISLLADSYAWVGVALGVIGFSFVSIGIGAAHKGSLGYLYCYAILITVWTILASVHIILMLGILSIPQDLMNPVLVLGQKIAANPTDPLKSVILLIYGIQGVTWSITVVCLVYLHLASRDPTLGFDIQNPKRKSRTHSLITQQQNTESIKKPNQLFLNMGQATVAPEYSHQTYGREKEKRAITYSSDQSYEMQPTTYRTERPLAACTGVEELDGSNGNNILYLPKGSRISQVVVTFRDDADDNLMERAETATLVRGKNGYDLGEMIFDHTGESLSESIFNAVQPLNSGMSLSSSKESLMAKESFVRVSNDSDITDGDTKAESPSLSAISTLDEYPVPDQENGSDFRLTESCKLSKSSKIFAHHLDQQQQQQRQRQQQYRDKCETEDRDTAHTLTLTRNNQDYPIVPERRSSINRAPLPGTQMPSSGLSRLYRISDEEESESDLESDEHIYDRGDYSVAAPCMQPNTSDPHHFAGEIVNIKQSIVQSNSHTSKSKPTLASLQYWRNKNNGNSNSNNNNSNSSSNSSNGSNMSELSCNNSNSTSPSAFNFVSNFGKKKKQSPAIPDVMELVIPTIVLHPDDEDDEPVRVLSESDIEYLITMPPVKLMTVEEREQQELENGYEAYEDEYYDDDYNDGYDYYDYQQRYVYGQEDEEYEEEEEISEEYEHHITPIRPCVEGEYDPYALDVPINLEIDLQGLEQGTAY